MAWHGGAISSTAKPWKRSSQSAWYRRFSRTSGGGFAGSRREASGIGLNAE